MGIVIRSFYCLLLSMLLISSSLFSQKKILVSTEFDAGLFDLTKSKVNPVQRDEVGPGLGLQLTLVGRYPLSRKLYIYGGPGTSLGTINGFASFPLHLNGRLIDPKSRGRVVSIHLKMGLSYFFQEKWSLNLSIIPSRIVDQRLLEGGSNSAGFIHYVFNENYLSSQLKIERHGLLSNNRLGLTVGVSITTSDMSSYNLGFLPTQTIDLFDVYFKQAFIGVSYRLINI